MKIQLKFACLLAGCLAITGLQTASAQQSDLGYYLQDPQSTRVAARSHEQRAEEESQPNSAQFDQVSWQSISNCADCCESCTCCPLFDECQDCGCLDWYSFTGFDSWRGVAEGTWQNNTGVHTGLNFGGAINEDTGLAWQLGGSFGVYDWTGRTSFPPEFAQTQQQTFFTAGLFRRANENSAWSWGVVGDQMINNNFGVYSTEPYLAQVRYQIAYATSERNEFGYWGTNQLNQSSQVVGGALAVNTRAVNQANLFWHHKYDSGADTWFYVGLPWGTRIVNNGTLGDFLFGGTITAPLNNAWSVYSNFMYLDPSASVPAASREYSCNVTVGLAWYPQQNARSRTVAGRRWMPYMPVANNGTFIVDQNVTF